MFGVIVSNGFGVENLPSYLTGTPNGDAFSDDEDEDEEEERLDSAESPRKKFGAGIGECA